MEGHDEPKQQTGEELVNIVIVQLEKAHKANSEGGMNACLAVLRAMNNVVPRTKAGQPILKAMREGLAKCGIPFSAIDVQINDSKFES